MNLFVLENIASKNPLSILAMALAAFERSPDHMDWLSDIPEKWWTKTPTWEEFRARFTEGCTAQAHAATPLHPHPTPLQARDRCAQIHRLQAAVLGLPLRGTPGARCPR
jgi:hypothetical protein